MLKSVLVLSVGKRALFKLDLKSALQALFKYVLESDSQTKGHVGNICFRKKFLLEK